MPTRSHDQAGPPSWRCGSSFEFTRRFGLEPAGTRTRTRLIVATIAVAYLPVVALALIGWAQTGTLEAWLLRAEVHVRLLGALSLIFIAETMLESRVDLVVRGIVDDEALVGSSREAWLARAAHARATERFAAIALTLIYAALACAHFGVLPSWGERWLLHGRSLATIDRTAAWWWYAVVAQPLLFLSASLWLFRWVLWTALLWRLARLGPTLHAAHSDRAGGLGFTRLPIDALHVYVLGVGGAIAAVWFDEIAAGRAQASTFASDLVGFLAAAVVVLHLPYAAFIRPLARERHRSMLRYSALTRRYLEQFERRWLDGPTPDDAELLGNPDASVLADLGASATAIEETRSTIPSGADLRLLLIIAAIPFVLVALAYGPSTAELLRAVINRFV